MSSGTARLKRRLDDQGINYTNKKAVENFCLVRLTATVGALELTHTSRLDRHSLASLGEKGRERICSDMETRCMPRLWLLPSQIVNVHRRFEMRRGVDDCMVPSPVASLRVISIPLARKKVRPHRCSPSSVIHC